MSLRGVGLLGVDSSRTRAYLDAMRKQDILPSFVIFLAGPEKKDLPEVPYFDNRTPALDVIKSLGVPHVVINTDNVNDPQVIEAVADCDVSVLVYSGPGGAILGKDILNAGKRFLHVHPGLVPQYRGSTTIYYSLLQENNCGASAIFLDETIDTGAIIATQTYPEPQDRALIDYGYDPYIRSDLLIRVLSEYQEVGEFVARPQSDDPGETYYIMHPVLRHIAVLAHKHSQDK